jgi:hypothetical protein
MPAVVRSVEHANRRSCCWNPRHKAIAGSVCCEDIELASTCAAPSATGQVDNRFVLAIAVQVSEGVRETIDIIVVGGIEARTDLADVILKEPLQTAALAFTALSCAAAPDPFEPTRCQTRVFDNDCGMVDDPEGEVRKLLLA